MKEKLFARLVTLREIASSLQMEVDYNKPSWRNTKAFKTYNDAQQRANEASTIIYQVLDLGKEFEQYILDNKGEK